MRIKSIFFSTLILSLAGCGDPAPNDADITDAKFLQCKSGKVDYDEWEGETFTFFATVYKWDNDDGVELKIRSEDCSGEELTEVDAPNLETEFVRKNRGKCVQIFAEVGDKNVFTPDVRVIEVLKVETDQERAASKLKREAREEKAKEEREGQVEKAKLERILKAKVKKKTRLALIKEHKNDHKWLYDEYGFSAAVNCVRPAETKLRYIVGSEYMWLPGVKWKLDYKQEEPYKIVLRTDKLKRKKQKEKNWFHTYFTVFMM